MKYISIVLICLFLISCGARRMEKQQTQIRDGMFTIYMYQAAFGAEWGKPDRTYTTLGSETMSAGINRFKARFYKGRHTLIVWEYDKRDTRLFFNIKNLLVGWEPINNQSVITQ